MQADNNRKTHWIIPDGFIPPQSTGEQTSHESICVLNANDSDAHLHVNIYFEDRDPIEEIETAVRSKRTSHIRTSSLEKDGKTIPAGVPYAIEVQSDVPIIVQYSRLDSTQPALALMSTMAFPL
ncbi:sensory rhodopsin transducer [Halobacillus sp. Marseille-P3879]|uniref:sensory rhodopsin transducer n=1 Tax=Halobacillus sp. Marseille-P3879 TaxID=2045014 RepID=UPI000C79868E|nr:sensory rhodopsin transducer [Halobacillus sp. Marseille-P3879]